jgi:hypothetical protein
LIIKTATAFFILSILWGCNKEKNQPRAVIPFKCINSQTTCEIMTKFGTVLVTFNVEKVLTELPFNLQVKFKNDPSLNAKSSLKHSFNVVGYMEGKTMFMGKIPLLFTEKVNNNDNHFIAETMLGSCSEDMMIWRLWLTIEKQEGSDNKEQTTFFIDFESSRF